MVAGLHTENTGDTGRNPVSAANPFPTFHLRDYLRLAIPLGIGGVTLLATFLAWPAIPQAGTIALVLFGLYAAWPRKPQERSLAEDLADSRGRFRRLIDTSPDPVSILRDYDFVYVNPALQRVLGLTLKDLRSGSMFERLHPDDRERSRGRMRTLLQRDTTLPLTEIRVLTAEGVYRYFEVLTVSISEQGSMTIQSILRDITERKVAQEQARATAEQYEMLTRVLPVGVWVSDVNGVKTYANQRCIDLLGLRFLPEGGSAADNLHPDDAPTVASAWFHTIRQRTTFEAEYRVLHNGVVGWVFAQAKPQFDANGELVGYVGTITDLSERKKMESMLLRAQRLESLGTLTGGIAHDFNNMLTPLMMAFKLLPRIRNEKDRAELLETGLTSVERGAAMVRQMLSFAGGVEGPRTNLNLADILREVERLLAHTIPKNITVRADASDDLWRVQGDSTQLAQVFMNLGVNSRDAMPEGGTLTFTARNLDIRSLSPGTLHPDAKPGRYLLVTVSDTGIGMASDVLNQMFDPFFTTKPPGQGTGLGLSTALGIVKSHRGFITVHSELNKGSSIAVYLPAQQDPSVNTVLSNTGFLIHGKDECVLLVDDEAPIRLLLRHLLEQYGYRVLLAEDGQAALNVYQLRKDEIDLVLIDMMMPVLDGPAAVRGLRQISPDLPIIGMSGQGFPRADLPATHGFLQKPFSDEQLLNVLAHAFGRSPVGPRG